RFGQLVQAVAVPVLARLVLARAQGVDRQVAQDVAGLGLELGRLGGGLGAEQGLEATAEAALPGRRGLGRCRLGGRGLGAHAGVSLSYVGSGRAWRAACSRSRWRRTTSPARPR